MRLFLEMGAIGGFLGVAFGAFGAHALKGRLSPSDMAVYQTATQYLMAHSLALVLIAGLPASKLPRATGWLFAVGAAVFSGSLYAFALTDATAFALVTPLGGLCFLAGWACLAVFALKKEIPRGG